MPAQCQKIRAMVTFLEDCLPPEYYFDSQQDLFKSINS